jgi:hypothetical protein
MKTKIGYKLFEMRDDGKLFPLFIGKQNETPVNEWVHAEIVMDHKGFAHRPGWHIGATIPSAPWLMSANGTYKSQRGKKFKRVWCEVEYAADVDYTHVVETLPKKCFTDKLPDGGFYNFRESGDRLWIIADRIKVTRILDETERLQILNEMGYDEMEAFAPYKKVFEKRMNIQNLKT